MSEQCNADVFSMGESVGFMDLPKAEAEAYCQKMTAETDYTYDWHYAAGRVHVMRLKKGFKKEMRYLVLKLKDMDCLNEMERDILKIITDKVAEHRAKAGKAPLEGVFIESDWNCYDAAWKLVRQEWESKQ